MGIFDFKKKREEKEKAERAKAAQAAAETYALNELLALLGLHDTADSALSEATYYACLKVLSESIGKLPLRLLQVTPNTGVTPQIRHRYYRMLNERPNRFMSASVFWTYMEFCRNHYGNAYALIDTSGPAPQLWPLDPLKVKVYYDDALLFSKTPDIFYVCATSKGTVKYSSEEVLHFKAHQTQDGILGISVREQLNNTIQGNVKAQKMVNKMYDSGMTAKAVLEYTGELNEESRRKLTASIEAYAKGGMKDSGIENIIPIPLGFKLTPLNVKLADSQFLEVKQYSALQIAAAFGVKPYQVGDYTKSSYASAEAQQLSFLIDTLLFNIKQYEEELSYKLLSDEESGNGLCAKFNTSVLLRTDQQSQIANLSTAVQSFLMTPNEARERLDLPHKEGGDQLVGNGSTIPITAVGSQYTDSVPAADISNTEREEVKTWIRQELKTLLLQVARE